MRGRRRSRSFTHSHCASLEGRHQFHAGTRRNENYFGRIECALRQADRGADENGKGEKTMNGSSSWIEPPPHQRGLGCFAKGCLILVVFFILLGLAFVAGTYYAAKYLRTEYFSSHHEHLPANRPTVEEQEAVRARWEAFEKAAHAHEAARIELSA